MKINFIGLLANTDSSVVGLKLDQGFEVSQISRADGIRLISHLERLPEGNVAKKLFMDVPCLNVVEQNYYCIVNSFDAANETPDGKWNAFARFNNKNVDAYLNPVLRLMRLFKEGNICMPLLYYYTSDKDIPKLFAWFGTFRNILSRPKYTLRDAEKPALEKFIRATSLPFNESFLELAFESFERSYQVHDMNLSFLSLMISLEILFNPGNQELSHRTSRNAAVLLGKDKNDSTTIFSEIKDLYNKRSKIVHAGKPNIINDQDLSKLRFYVMESIKEISQWGKNKNELLDLLNSYGFGERKTKKRR